METNLFTLTHLIEQLGFENSQQSIERLVVNVAPIPSDIELWEAPEWSAEQAAKIKQWKELTSPRSDAVEQLESLLRA